MNTINSYIDDLKEIYGSYNKVASELSIQPQRLLNIRKGEAIPDDMLLRMSELLKIDVIELIAAKNAERSKTPEMKKKWEHVAKGVAASLVIVFAGFFSNVDTAKAAYSAENSDQGMYIMLNNIRVKGVPYLVACEPRPR